MEWYNVVSVVFNIILLVVIIWLLLVNAEIGAEKEYHLEQWQKWEERFYEAQGIVHEQLGYHISPKGLHTETTLKKMKDKSDL